MPDDTLLSVEGLRSGYGASPVLLGVDLDVRRGEVVAVIGRNGVGKTTLMRTLCGLIAPSAGRIRFGGRDVTAEPADRRARGGLAYIPQGRDVFPTADRPREPAGRRGGAQRAGQARLRPGLPHFPVLKERERQSAGTLSGGQQQQLAIARAMIGEPVLMLLDEPSEGIQPSIVQEIARHIRALNAEAGMTVLFVEQNLDLIVSLADRGLSWTRGASSRASTARTSGSRDVVKRFLAL